MGGCGRRRFELSKGSGQVGLGIFQVSQCPDPGLESEAAVGEVGTQGMLPDRWDLTMVC